MKKKTICVVVTAAALAGLGAWWTVDPLLPTKMLAHLRNQEAAQFMANQYTFGSDDFFYWWRFVDEPTPENLHTYDAETQKDLKLLWEARGIEISPTN